LETTCFKLQISTLMKLTASTMLSATIKRQYHSVPPLLRHCLTVFDEIYEMAMSFVFFVQITLMKLVNTPVDKSLAVVLSVIN